MDMNKATTLRERLEQEAAKRAGEQTAPRPPAQRSALDKWGRGHRLMSLTGV